MDRSDTGWAKLDELNRKREAGQLTPTEQQRYEELKKALGVEDTPLRETHESGRI